MKKWEVVVNVVGKHANTNGMQDAAADAKRATRNVMQLAANADTAANEKTSPLKDANHIN